MTIYILSNDASENAKLLDDKALGKMISACAQVLCNVHYMHLVTMTIKDDKRPVIPMLSTDYFNCEWSQWARTCLANYNALLAYAKACCDEWMYRTVDDYAEHKYPGGYCGDCDMKHEAFAPKKHKHHDVIEWCERNKPDLPTISSEVHIESRRELQEKNIIPGHTPLPLVMPHEYIIMYGEMTDRKPTDYSFVYYNLNIKPNTTESYRAYYKAKLRKMARKLCKKCNGNAGEFIGQDHYYVACDEPYCIKGYNVKNHPVWTRRERPDFLGDF